MDYSLDKLDRMEAGEFDLIAVGRALIANADWAELVRRGEFELLTFDKSMLTSLEGAVAYSPR